MIAEGEHEQKVKVWGKTYVISVYQKSKTVWIARGAYHGESIEAQGRSLSSAAKAWAEKARYKGN
jgi:hypothetical protein